MRIGILGHYGDYNLGDEATINAVIQNLRRENRAWDPVCISVNPDDSSVRFDVDAYPVHRVSKNAREMMKLRAKNLDVSTQSSPDSPSSVSSSLRSRLKQLPLLVVAVKVARRIVASVRSIGYELAFIRQALPVAGKLDLLLIAGSNQLFDHVGGPWYFPYNIFRWAMLARICRKPYAIVCVGAGPVESAISRFMIRKVIQSASYCSFRDNNSIQVLKEFVPGNTFNGVLPDLAFSLQTEVVLSPSESEAAHWEMPDESRQMKVALNPMPLFDPRFWPDSSEEKYACLVSKYAALVETLIDQNNEISFYATHPKDALVVSDIINELGMKELANSESCYPTSVSELMALIQNADVAIATRFHGVVLPYVVCKPVVAIEYWPKTGDLMKYMGQEDYLVERSEFMDNTRVGDCAAVLDRFSKLKANFASAKTTVSESTSRQKAILRNQYCKIWTLVESPKGED